ncbi:hypothetical protein [Lysobacter gummosus]
MSATRVADCRRTKAAVPAGQRTPGGPTGSSKINATGSPRPPAGR